MARASVPPVFIRSIFSLSLMALSYFFISITIVIITKNIKCQHSALKSKFMSLCDHRSKKYASVLHTELDFYDYYHRNKIY